MFALYIFSAIVGVSLLALGALGGDGGPDDIELDWKGDLDLASAGSDASWKKAFSMRAAAYFLAGFGATGLLLTLVEVAAVLTFGLALGMGGFSAALIVVLFGWLRSSEGGFAKDAQGYIGAVGQVRVPIREGAPGSVAIEHRGRLLTMRARAMGTPDSDPSTWSRVLVVDVDEGRGILLVQPVGEFLADDDAPPDLLTEQD
jgi:hypothetical protein